MITQGKWTYSGNTTINRNDPVFCWANVVCGGRRVARAAGIGEEEAMSNARLIAEAGTVYNETGFTPKQLAESKAELLAASEAMVKHINDGFYFILGKADETINLKQAIAKAEPKA